MFSSEDMLFVLAIAETGSVTGAASRLYTSQSALSRSLGNLETRIGASLFTRMPRGMVPTEVGDIVAAHARVVFATTERARAIVDAQVSSKVVVLRIGIVPYISVTPIAKAVIQLGADIPNTRCDISIGDPAAMREKLQQGELDLIIGPVESPSPGIKVTPLFEDSIVLMVHRDHPINNLRTNLRALLSYEWIVPPADNRLTQCIEAFLSDAGLESPVVRAITSDLPLTVTLAAVSDCIVAIPRDVALSGIPNDDFRILDVDIPGTNKPIGVMQMRELAGTQESTLFMAVLAKELREIGLCAPQNESALQGA